MTVVLLCIFSLPVSWGGLSPPCTPSWDTSGNGCWSRCVGFACTAWKLRWSCKDKLVKNRVIRLHKSSPRGRIPCLAHPAVSADGCRCRQGDSGLPHHKAAMPLGFDCSAGRGLLAGAEEWSVGVRSHCPVPRLPRRGWPWAGFPSARGSGRRWSCGAAVREQQPSISAEPWSGASGAPARGDHRGDVLGLLPSLAADSGRWLWPLQFQGCPRNWEGFRLYWLSFSFGQPLFLVGQTHDVLSHPWISTFELQQNCNFVYIYWLWQSGNPESRSISW